jgi:hypothetical protein
MTLSRTFFRRIGIVLAAALSFATPSTAAPTQETYTVAEIVSTGHQFFGQISGGLATMVEKIVSSYGLPNGYIIGEEGSGAFVGGLRYGDGVLYTKLDAPKPVYWQGPSVGWDFGGDGNRTMMLVYDLPSSLSIYRRYGGVNGSLRHDGPRQYRDPGANCLCRPHQERRRRPARPQYRLFEVHAQPYLEPLLTPNRFACQICYTRKGFRVNGGETARAPARICCRLPIASIIPFTGAFRSLA